MTLQVFTIEANSLLTLEKLTVYWSSIYVDITLKLSGSTPIMSNQFPIMTDHPPFNPPPQLVKQWVTDVWHEGTPARLSLSDMHIATEAARWSADQELEACCEWLANRYEDAHALRLLRSSRRPKPPSLKKQALASVKQLEEEAHEQLGVTGADHQKTMEAFDSIRTALEALND